MSLLSKPSSAYDLATKLLVLTGALHILGFVVTGLAIIPMAAFGVVYLLLGLGMWRGWRKLAYLSFLFAMIGAIVAYANLPAGGFVYWLMILFILIDLVIIVALFLDIWKRK